MLSTAKTAFKVYSVGRSTVAIVTKPGRWVRDQVVSLLKSLIVKAFMAAAGRFLSTSTTGAIQDASKSFKFSVTVPSAARKLFDDPEILPIVESVANDALAAPLALAGYRIGTLSATHDLAQNLLSFDLEMKLAKA